MLTSLISSCESTTEYDAYYFYRIRSAFATFGGMCVSCFKPKVSPHLDEVRTLNIIGCWHQSRTLRNPPIIRRTSLNPESLSPKLHESPVEGLGDKTITISIRVAWQSEWEPNDDRLELDKPYLVPVYCGGMVTPIESSLKPRVTVGYKTSAITDQ